MTAMAVAGRHPLLQCAETIEAALADVTDVSPVFMNTRTKREVLLRVAQVESELAALKLRLVAASDDVADHDGARDVATWLAQHTRDDRRERRREQTLAQAMDRRWALVGQGLAEARLNVAQAHVIARALDALPVSDLEPEVLAQAEEHLVAQAAFYGPADLVVLGRKVLEVVAPEVGEAHEARQLAAEERRAREVTRLVTQRLGDGATRIVITVPDLVATRLCTYLEAFTSPR